ncbi:MAG: hypothetical protein IPF56_18370 [Chloroflexi bacterium]|nr:hypothetical protein [Chloroflexota bacterium]
MDPLTKSFAAVFFILLVLAGCRQADQPVAITQVADLLPTASVTAVSPTPTATATLSPTAVPSPTLPPTATPTPTATAVPLVLTGNPRAAQLANLPAPQRAATCGIVDILDFPSTRPMRG